MQLTQHIRRKFAQIVLATFTLLFFASVPAMAYSTRQSATYPAGGGYYSTRYGWVGSRPTQQPAPAPAPIPSPAPKPIPPPPPPPNTGSITAEEMQLVNLVNQERTKAGVASLTADPQLAEVARTKSQDMVARNYFGHTSPTFGSTFSLVRSRGISYSIAGENLAGAANVATAHRMLMDSPGHRANILEARFKKIGVGVARGGPYGAMYTQIFLG